MKVRAIVIATTCLVTAAQAATMDINPQDQGGQFVISAPRPASQLTERHIPLDEPISTPSPIAAESTSTTHQPSSIPSTSVATVQNSAQVDPAPQTAEQPLKLGANVYLDAALVKKVSFPAPVPAVVQPPPCAQQVTEDTMTVCFGADDVGLSDAQKRDVETFTSHGGIYYVDVYSHESGPTSVKRARSRSDTIQTLLTASAKDTEVHYFARIGHDCLSGCGDRAVIRKVQLK